MTHLELVPPRPRTHRLWGGAFAGQTAPELEVLNRSIGTDYRLWPFDIRLSKAWAVGLWGAGVLTLEESTLIERGLDVVGARLAAGVTPAAADEDIHTLIDRLLHEEIGETASKLHTGRSRNDQVATASRLWAMDAAKALDARIRDLQQVMLDHAAALDGVLMPSYTHMQRAQPVAAGHWMLSHFWPLDRDRQRLTAAARAAAVLPLGSGAIAGTSYAIDVAALAADLGFSRPVLNSIDATGDRDFVAGFLHAAALAMVHLSRLAEDTILFTSEEFGFFDLADTAATGSSLMPQKKNPDPLELVRGKCGRVIGRLAGWLTTMKGLPIGYSKDLQEDKEALFEAEDTLRASLEATTSVVGGLVLERTATERAASGLLLATDVADYLVAKGVPFRDAHEIVGSLVRRLLRERRSFESMGLDEWRQESPLFEADVRAVITPAASIGRKRTPQSTHPDAVAAALAELRRWLSANA